MRLSCQFSLTCLFALLTATSLVAADYSWPQWRGPNRDDVSKETGLLKEWPKGGPKLAWVNGEVGVGFASFSIANGKLFTTGGRGEAEFILCLDANTGTEVWSARIDSLFNDRRGDGPRGTPTIDGDSVYAMGGRGMLICASIADGQVRWQKSMASLGGKAPGWGYCESILVDGEHVVCTPGGGSGAIAKLDKQNGNVLWQSTDVTDRAQYSSIITAEHNGQKQYIQLFTNSLVGVAADSGNLLWKTYWGGRTAVIPTPIFHDGHVFITSGYKVGCKLVKVGDGNKVEDVYENTNMINHHGGVVLLGEHLYGYSDDKGWLCMEFKTGKIVWSERGALGKGCVTYADGMLYCMDEKDGTIVLAEASPAGWQEHGRFRPENQSRRGSVWPHLVVCNGKLYFRNQESLSCFDVKAQ